MINPDILRIMAELHTFTAEDLANEMECPVGTVGGLLPGWTQKGYVVRVRSARTYIYALSDKGQRLHAKLPVLDENERCLPVSFEGVTPCDCYGSGEQIIHERCVGSINHGATLVYRSDSFCRNCGAHWSTSEYVNTPF